MTGTFWHRIGRLSLGKLFRLEVVHLPSILERNIWLSEISGSVPMKSLKSFELLVEYYTTRHIPVAVNFTLNIIFCLGSFNCLTLCAKPNKLLPHIIYRIYFKFWPHAIYWSNCCSTNCRKWPCAEIRKAITSTVQSERYQRSKSMKGNRTNIEEKLFFIDQRRVPWMPVKYIICIKFIILINIFCL